MTIRVSGKNLDIGESLRTQVQERVTAALAKYADGRGSGNVVVARDGSGFRTDCVVDLGSGIRLESEGLANDAYASFDQSAVRIEKRLRRHKRRIKDRLVGANSMRSPEAIESAYSILSAPLSVPDDDTYEEPEYHPIVIAEATRPLNRLSVSEAVLELDLSGSPVVVFRHAGNGRVNVVYRRNDGSIGWVDPPSADS